MAKPYKLRRALGKILHESDTFIVSRTVVRDDLQVFDKRKARVVNVTEAQQKHLKRCLEALRGLHVRTESGSKAYDILVDDFASAVFHCGLRLERAFFKTSPESRAYSALVRTQIDSASADEVEDVEGEW